LEGRGPKERPLRIAAAGSYSLDFLLEKQPTATKRWRNKHSFHTLRIK